MAVSVVLKHVGFEQNCYNISTFFTKIIQFFLSIMENQVDIKTRRNICCLLQVAMGKRRKTQMYNTCLYCKTPARYNITLEGIYAIGSISSSSSSPNKPNSLIEYLGRRPSVTGDSAAGPDSSA